jgi:hypothetical protein
MFDPYDSPLMLPPSNDYYEPESTPASGSHRLRPRGHQPLHGAVCPGYYRYL